MSPPSNALGGRFDSGLYNYELGFKTESPGARLIWNTAAYLMSWKNYQTIVNIPSPPYSFQANFGDARIARVESTVERVPIDDKRRMARGRLHHQRGQQTAPTVLACGVFRPTGKLFVRF